MLIVSVMTKTTKFYKRVSTNRVLYLCYPFGIIECRLFLPYRILHTPGIIVLL